MSAAASPKTCDGSDRSGLTFVLRKGGINKCAAPFARSRTQTLSVIILQHTGGFNDRLTPSPESGCKNATFWPRLAGTSTGHFTYENGGAAILLLGCFRYWDSDRGRKPDYLMRS